MNNEDGYANGSNGGLPILSRRTSISHALADRLPPHHEEAEECVLGAILRDEASLTTFVDFLKVTHFYRNHHQQIYAAILALYEQGVAIDTITVSAELAKRNQLDEIGGVAHLLELMESFPHTANAECHARIVQETGDRREIIEAGVELTKDGYSTFFTVDELRERALGRITKTESVDDDDGLADAWPEPIAKEGWHGVAAEFVKAIAPHSEADANAILIQLLIALGNIVGRKPHWIYERTEHHLNNFACIVGRSAKAKKGTSWDHVMFLLREIDALWCEDRIKKGLQSGHGIVGAVQDSKISGANLIEMGVEDKRLLFVQPEFGSVLTAMGWQGSTLSHMVREVWDYGNLELTKLKDSTKATNAHVSIIGHITLDELKLRLSAVDSVNGFANRFLWVCAKRSKLLPRGGRINDVNYAPFVDHIKDTVKWLRDWQGEAYMERTPEAWDMWDAIYTDLQTPLPGILGSITDRGEAHILRIASIYAVLDRKLRITPQHLAAGYAIWRYCVASAKVIFGGVVPSPMQQRQDKLLAALRTSESGMRKREIRCKVYGGHISKEDIDQVLRSLVHAGAIEQVKAPVSGGSSSVWRIARLIAE